MKYVFFGTPRFAEILLGRLIEAGMPPVALVCNPDRPVGRKKIVTPPLTKQLVAAQSAAIQVLQPEKLEEDFTRQLKALQTDFFVVAAYAKIIPNAVLKIPRLGTLGVHPSLLPKYRGASPIQSAILNGERDTGVTIYQMDEKMDHGPIIAVSRLPVAAHESYTGLEEKLAKLSAETLTKTIPAFLTQKVKPLAQDEAQATYTKKFTTQDGFVDGADLDEALAGDAERAETIIRKIHALNPEPGCWTMKNAKRTKLLEAKLSGTHLVLVKIQNEGERPKAFQAGS